MKMCVIHGHLMEFRVLRAFSSSVAFSHVSLFSIKANCVANVIEAVQLVCKL